MRGRKNDSSEQQEVKKQFFKKSKKDGVPNLIVANTIKGKGIKEFENDPAWHARKLQGKELEIGKKTLKIN